MRTSLLFRKLRRDLRHLVGQVVAIALVVACGDAAIVAMRTNYDSLIATRDVYYRTRRFATLFVHLRRAPETVARRLAEVPGVATVETRVVADVVLDVPGLAEPATGRLVSVPDRGRPVLNDLHLRAGRWLDPARDDEVLASEAFAEANRLHPGDRIAAVVNGRWRRFTIAGVALSPEYVYSIGPGQVFPDDRRFGVLWIRREAAAAAFDLTGAFNDAVFGLAPGAAEATVIAAVDRLLDPWGGLGAFGRRDLLSARFLDDEIAQHKVSGTLIGYVFLGIAAFLVNLVLARLVATQREQIGVLKAFGFPNGPLALHFLLLGLVPAVAGTVLGAALGVWLGGLVTEVFATFYRFPVLAHVTRPDELLATFLVSVGAAALGALRAVRLATTLTPAVAMRPDAPVAFRSTWLDRLGVRHLGPALRMALRNIGRRPVKAALTLLGLALACGLLVMGRFFVDAVRFMTDLEFHRAQRQDAMLVFAEPRADRVAFDVGHLPGVQRTELYRVVPVRLRAGPHVARTVIMGLEPGGTLRRLVDRRLREQVLPAAGLLIGAEQAHRLGLRVGDTVTVEVLEGSRPVRRLVVGALIDDLIGNSAYLDRRAVARLLGEGPTASGALVAVERSARPALAARLKGTPIVAGVNFRAAMIRSFEETLARSMGMTTAILTTFAGVIAVAMVYNGLRIALSERARELASLRVLGFTRAETTRMLVAEFVLLVVASLPAGWALGWLTCWLIVISHNTELFRLPLAISRGTYGYASLVMLLAAVFAVLVVRRRIHRLDLVTALKTRE